MTTSKRNPRILAVVLTLSTALGLASQAHAYDVYRRVAVTAGTTAVAWNAANFGVGGAPPTLSFFHYANDDAARAAMHAAQCFIKVTLPNTVPAPAPLAHDTVGTALIQFNAALADMPLPFPWRIDFDNNPADHWSIPKAQITAAASNNAASRVANAGFNKLATTPGSLVTVIDGTLNNCHA